MFAFPALAADLPVEPAPVLEPAAVAPAGNWTGFYLGVIGGYGWGDFDVESSGTFEPPDEVPYNDFSVDADGAFIGAQLGYDHQIVNLVFGVVGDLSWADIDGADGTEFDFVEVLRVAPTDDFAVAAGIDWFGTLRGKVGYAFGNFMIYGTGGLAFGHTEAEIGYASSLLPALPPPPPGSEVAEANLPNDQFPNAQSFDDTRIGFALGAGLAAIITPNLVAEVGYLFVDLGEESYEVDSGFGVIGKADIDYSLHLVRAGLSYKF